MPALDGVRGLACLLVVIGHFAPNPIGNKLSLLTDVSGYLHIGNFGVVLFFCLSAFLLSFLFVKEFDAHGANNIKWFFLRRTLRIWPLYFCFLLIVNVALVFHVLPEASAVPAKAYLERYNVLLFLYLSNWIYATNIFTFTNIIPPNTGFLNVLWSLAVEEQIYILFPFVAGALLVARKRRVTAVRLILLSLLSRALYVVLNIALSGSHMNGGMYYSTFSYFDVYLISGLMGALHARNLPSGALGDLMDSHYTALAAVGLLLLYMHVLGDTALPPYRAVSIIIYPIVGTLAAGLILYVVRASSGFTARLLSTQVARACGVLAYSAYIWHLFIVIFLQAYFFSPHRAAAMADSLVAQVAYLTLYLGLVFAVASVSHGVIELPFLRLKERYSATGGVAFFSWKKYGLYSSALSVVACAALWCALP